MLGGHQYDLVIAWIDLDIIGPHVGITQDQLPCDPTICAATDVVVFTDEYDIRIGGVYFESSRCADFVGSGHTGPIEATVCALKYFAPFCPAIHDIRMGEGLVDAIDIGLFGLSEW